MTCSHRRQMATGYDDMRACLDCGATVIVETPERIAAARRTSAILRDGGCMHCRYPEGTRASISCTCPCHPAKGARL